MKQLFYDVLIDIIINPHISLTELESKWHLNRSQLDYQLAQANKFLTDHHVAPLIRNHHYRSSELSINQLEDLLGGERLRQTTYFNKKTRSLLLPILLFTQKETGLAELANHLLVSKNTLLSDLSALKKQYQRHDVAITHSRKTGYALIGAELAIRTIIARCLMELIKEAFPLATLLPLLGMTPFQFDCHLTKLTDFQLAIGSKFSDIYETFLVVLILLSNNRSPSHPMTAQDNRDLMAIMTKEDFAFTHTHLEEVVVLSSQQDLPFIAIHILSANVISSKDLGNSQLSGLMDEVIAIFETSMAITIDHHQQLNALLTQHIAPAIYRLKYGLPYEDSQLLEFSKDYQRIFLQVSAALKPLEAYYGISFNYTETVYVVLLFQSFIQKSDQLLPQRYRAIVVCKSGLAVSRLLYKSLSEMFPTIDFIKSMSLKEYEEQSANEMRADIIFSTIFVETDKKLFIIKQLLNQADKDVLRRNVNQYIGGYEQPLIDVTDILELISHNAQVHDHGLLEKELATYLLSASPTHVVENPLALTDILTLEDIKFTTRQLDFDEAIRALGEPLLKKKAIEPGYLESIITQYNPDYPYFIIAPGIAIPHAAPTDGVHRLSMSLLRVSQAVPFSAELSASLLLLIAPQDNKLHQEALLHFYDFVNVPDQRRRLMACRNKAELYDVLRENNL